MIQYPPTQLYNQLPYISSNIHIIQQLISKVAVLTTYQPLITPHMQQVKGSTSKCEYCSIRIPKNRQNLKCWICSEIKHQRCQGLSRVDANKITDDTGYDWICKACIEEILPLEACHSLSSINPKPKDASSRINTEPFKVLCHSCNSYAYKKTRVVHCSLCKNPNHPKCSRDVLGCLRCCQETFPGYS